MTDTPNLATNHAAELAALKAYEDQWLEPYQAKQLQDAGADWRLRCRLAEQLLAFANATAKMHKAYEDAYASEMMAGRQNLAAAEVELHDLRLKDTP